MLPHIVLPKGMITVVKGLEGVTWHLCIPNKAGIDVSRLVISHNAVST